MGSGERRGGGRRGGRRIGHRSLGMRRRHNFGGSRGRIVVRGKAGFAMLPIFFGIFLCFPGIVFTAVFCDFSHGTDTFCVLGPVLLGIGLCLLAGGIIACILLAIKSGGVTDGNATVEHQLQQPQTTVTTVTGYTDPSLQPPVPPEGPLQPVPPMAPVPPPQQYPPMYMGHQAYGAYPPPPPESWNQHHPHQPWGNNMNLAHPPPNNMYNSEHQPMGGTPPGYNATGAYDTQYNTSQEYTSPENYDNIRNGGSAPGNPGPDAQPPSYSDVVNQK